MDPITTVMRQCRLFDGIPEEKYQNVLACLRGEPKSFRKDAILLQIGECQKRPGVVMDGTLRISLYSEDGNLVTIERLGRGQVFGETLVCSMAEDSPIQIDALTDVQVLYLDFDPLLLQQECACPHKAQVTANLLREMGRAPFFSIRKCGSWPRTGSETGSSSISRCSPPSPAANSIWTWGGANWPTICV